ncbi:MAG: 30S ribosomal protein S17 [Planctomycetota bacterium]|jgi:small subunit ribosomal protein S17
MAEPKSTTRAGSRRGRTGTVASIAGDKTIGVVIENLVRHPRYGKYVRRRTRLAVHDPKGDASVGDVVEVVPCRPISKTKSWRLARVIRRASAEAAEVSRSGQ